MRSNLLGVGKFRHRMGTVSLQNINAWSEIELVQSGAPRDCKSEKWDFPRIK